MSMYSSQKQKTPKPPCYSFVKGLCLNCEESAKFKDCPGLNLEESAKFKDCPGFGWDGVNFLPSSRCVSDLVGDEY